MRVLELHILQDTGPHIVTVSVHLQVALESVACADLCGQGNAHAAVILLQHLWRAERENQGREEVAVCAEGEMTKNLQSQVWGDVLLADELVEGCLERLPQTHAPVQLIAHG